MTNKFFNIFSIFIFLLLFTLFVPASYAGYTFNFTHIDEDGDGPQQILDGQIGESQLKMDVDLLTQDIALFTFRNIGPDASSITDIYFEDNTGLFDSFIDFIEMPGVAFSQGASPPNLPGGNNVGFNVTPGFAFDSDPPAQPKGVNPDEQLGIKIKLTQTYISLNAGLEALKNALDPDTGNLRVGIHVQGYASGGSEAFINGGNGDTPGGVVPEPGTMVLVGFGLIGFARFARKKNNKTNK